MLAQKPTAMSFEPLRRIAPKRCPRENGSMPGGTFWKALSGQLEKNRAMALLVLALGLEGGIDTGICNDITPLINSYGCGRWDLHIA